MDEADLFRGRRILVVEDEYMVAEILTQMLEDAGATIVGPFGWREEVLDFISDNEPKFDLAVLDVNLHGQVSYPIADRLMQLAVPFIFTTGYGGEALNEAYRTHPRCQKPFQRGTLLEVLAALAA